MNSSSCSAVACALDEASRPTAPSSACISSRSSTSISAGTGGVARPARRARAAPPRTAARASPRRGEQRRLPLPAVVNALEPAVVQLVAAVQRQVQILVVDGRRHGGKARAAACAAPRTMPRSPVRAAAEVSSCARPTHFSSRRSQARGRRATPRGVLGFSLTPRRCLANRLHVPSVRHHIGGSRTTGPPKAIDSTASPP